MQTTLNKEQEKAVKTTKGRVLVLAGAGSGKTSVLSHRIAYLIQVEGVDPTHIIGLTFTNKAALEMRLRLSRVIGPKEAKKVTLCTFHSFCMNLLRKEIHHLGYTKNFTLYDEKDVRRVLVQIVRHSLAHEGELPSLESTLAKITASKSLGKEFLEEEGDSWYGNFSKDLLHRLSSSMRSYNAVDFDSLLTLSVKLLQEQPLVLQALHNTYHYIMIDEYQDTNPIQYTLAELLTGPRGNLCVVGDDDQSIYGWRGAKVKHILEFPADTTIKLEQNYRSTPSILRAANAVIGNNQERHKKNLWSARQEGSKVLLFHAPNEMEEAQSIAARMAWFHREMEIPWKDMAILYRSNSLSKVFETTLSQFSWYDKKTWRRGIPYEVFGGNTFYSRAEIKDLLAYLRVIQNRRDEEALLRIVNVPRRGISEQCLKNLTEYNRSKQVPLWDLFMSLREFPPPEIRDKISKKGLQGIENLLQVIEESTMLFNSSSLHTAFSSLVEKIDYKKAIKEDVKSEKMREFKWESVLSCIDSIASYEEEKKKEGKTPSLEEFLSTTLLQNDDPKRQTKEAKDAVSLMTVHSAKGLEFDICFISCLEDHIMPHEKSIKENGLEEERRLMYVAMTRAKKYLFLSMAKERKVMGKKTATTPSRFLFEIPKELLKITSYQTIDPT